MSVASIDLNDRSVYPTRVVTGGAQVWTKASWAEAFTLRPDLIPVQSVWTMAPDVSTAALEYRFGRVLVPGESAYQTLARITARGYWVLIRWVADDGSLIDWLGYAETPVTNERWPARDSLPETGLQTIPCFGLMRALEQCLVDNTVYADPNSEDLAIRSGGTGSIFNEGIRGNRSAEKRKLEADGPLAYVFAGPNDPTATWWSTRDIVEHLATFHLPTPASAAVAGGVPWQVNNLAVLPEWDRPSIDSDLRDVASMLRELIEPSKMLSWGIGITGSGVEPPTITAVTINPFSLLASPLVLPSGTLPASTDQVDIAWLTDPLTRVEFDEDASGVVDQVIVEGPREIAIATLYAYPTEEAPFEQGWTVPEQGQYEAGGTPWPDFATATVFQKRDINERYRTTGKMRDVYSLYKLKANWDGLIGGEPMFYKAEGDEVYIPSPLGLEVLDYLPLFAEVDYDGEPNTIDESAGLTLRKPVLSFRERDTDGTLLAERFYVDASGRLSLPQELMKASPLELTYKIDERLNVRLIVANAPQHAIAGKGFIGNLGDLDQETLYGDIYHQGWNLTVAVRGDRRPRYAIPADVSTLDVVRRKVVRLDDDSLASVYITKDTLVGFANDTPNTTTSPGGLLRDPTPILQSLCEMLAAQHGQPRMRASIRTGRRLPQLQLGSLVRVVESAGAPINAPICEIRIDAPTSDGGQPPAPPVQSFIASPYRVDVLSLLGTRGNGRQAKRQRKHGEKRTIIPREQRRPLVPRGERMARRRGK